MSPGRKWALPAALISLAAWACATSPAEPPRSLARLWHEFLKMPEERALAIAGDPGYRWVAGASGGHASREEAQEGALSECRRHRLEHRMQDPCRLFAVGDEIVWPFPVRGFL